MTENVALGSWGVMMDSESNGQVSYFGSLGLHWKACPP